MSTVTPSEQAPSAPLASEPEQMYAARCALFREQAEQFGTRSRSVSNFRGLCFLALLVCSGASVFGSGASWKWASLLLLLVFGVLVWWHSRILGMEDNALRWLQVNIDARSRCGKGFKDLDQGVEFRNPLHPYADDLDVFGRASLYQLLNVARTQFGKRRVAAYLMNRATPKEVSQRQHAAQELTPLLDVRQRFEALGLFAVEPLQAATGAAAKKRPAPDLAPLIAWAEGPQLLRHSKSLRVVSWLLPPATLFWMIWCMSTGKHPINWILPLIVQAILLLSAKRHVDHIFSVVSSHQGAFLRFGPMLGLIEQLNSDAELLRELKQATLSREGRLPSEMMRRFERILAWFEFRHNGLVYPIINVLLLWDIHCVFLLEQWQQESGKQLRGWFQVLGEFEALSSLASFAHDHPDFAWPVVLAGQTQFVAEELGHPLIADGRVTNSLSLDGPGRALLVTGSNMSGKSTLLRSMGLNAVLAQAGAPVCAKALRMGPLAVRTSMRISDSLEQGVSHFYAELRKLKAVLDSSASETPVFFLLDEVLHGTNSRERQIGARWLLGELLRRGALGAVSTHDSGLCELPMPLMDLVHQVHLRETAVGEELTFDFKLREGPVQSGNALRLMRSIGIAVPLE